MDNELNENESGINMYNLNQIDEKEKYIKIFYLSFNDKIKNNENNPITIEREYIFNNNYELLGELNDKLLLLNYNKKDNSECEFYIFDFSICQFIYSFKLHNIWYCPKLFIKINSDKLIDIKRFVICDENLNLFQYFYDNNYMNKIYYINNSIQIENKTKSKPSKFISLDNRIIILCNNNELYLLNL